MKKFNLTYLVMDCGLYCEQANALADGGKNRVLYFTPWWSKDPHYADYVIGKGFEYLEKILYFEDYIPIADCIVFFDVSGNAQCNYLRNTLPNKSIWGAGLGERLENDRLMLKKWCEQFNLPVNKYKVVTGITALKNYLKVNPNKYVKINIFRGDMESFYAKDYTSVEMKLIQIECAFGPHKEEYDFIVEDPIKTDVEVGFDGFFNGREFIEPYFIGYEYHKNLYVAHVTDELPVPIEETLTAFQPLFTKMNYRGAMSTEEKIVSEKEHYFLDACMRLPNPLSALYSNPDIIRNWPEVVEKVGRGQDVELDIEYKYVGAYGLTSLDADKQYLNITIDPKYRNDIRYQMVAGRKDGSNYSVPGWPIVAILTAGGNSVDEVLTKLKSQVDHVEAISIEKDEINAIDVIKDVIKKGESVGIPFK